MRKRALLQIAAITWKQVKAITSENRKLPVSHFCHDIKCNSKKIRSSKKSWLHPSNHFDLSSLRFFCYLQHIWLPDGQMWLNNEQISWNLQNRIQKSQRKKEAGLEIAGFDTNTHKVSKIIGWDCQTPLSRCCNWAADSIHNTHWRYALYVAQC